MNEISELWLVVNDLSLVDWHLAYINSADKIPPMKLRKVGFGWNISKRAPIRLEDVEVTPPPATPSPPRRSKRLRKKQNE